jgi:hypothetical protein
MYSVSVIPRGNGFDSVGATAKLFQLMDGHPLNGGAPSGAAKITDVD